MVKNCEVPVQLPVEGVTVMVAVTATLLLFIAVKEAMSPEPLAGKPMLGSLLVHVKVVPGIEPTKFTAAVEEWSQGV